jgi:hypothetical protein
VQQQQQQSWQVVWHLQTAWLLQVRQLRGRPLLQVQRLLRVGRLP